MAVDYSRPERGEPLPKPQSRAAEKKKTHRADEKAWLALRKTVLTRDRYRCRCCGEDITKNCAAMCRVCHAELHAYRLYVEGETRHSEPNADSRLRFVRV
jgi:hypothetical protein